MDDRPQINSDLVNVNKSELLGKIKSVFFQYFEPAVDDCCMRIDLEFGLQLVKKNNEKIKYELRNILKSSRENINMGENATPSASRIISPAIWFDERSAHSIDLK